MHRAKKRFGQNFLHDPVVIERILRSINAQPDDCVVEIGPGLGALTAPLLTQLNRLSAVEIDRDVIDTLQALPNAAERLTLINQDALRIKLSALELDLDPVQGRQARIVGNLPYNISSPLLFKLFTQLEYIQDMHFMLQKEVVQRMTAEPGNKTYGRLTVMVARYCEATALFDVGPGAFNPPPAVNSAVVRLVPHSATPFPCADEPRLLDQVVRAAFEQRRKTLRNCLKKLLTPEQITAADCDPALRAENLSPADFGRLSLALEQSQSGYTPSE